MHQKAWRTDGRTDGRPNNPEAICPSNFFEVGGIKTRWQPSWISNQNDFSYCWSTSHLDTSNELWVNCPFGSGEKVQNRFSRRPQFGISNRNGLNYFYLQVTPMLPTKFRVNWPFSSEGEGKNRFSRWVLSWISDSNDFSYLLYLQVIPMLPTNFQINWPFGSGKKEFQDGQHGSILDFQSKQFKQF